MGSWHKFMLDLIHKIKTSFCMTYTGVLNLFVMNYEDVNVKIFKYSCVLLVMITNIL